MKDQSKRVASVLEGDVAVTMFPASNTPEHLAKFRWNMQVALPYPFPTRKCITREVSVGETPYKFQIHNHFDRVIQTLRDARSGATWPRAFMHDRRNPLPKGPSNCVQQSRKRLQSVVFFNGLTEFSTADEAWSKCGERIHSCMEYLSSFLAACQREAPYLSAWLLYPVSLFDVGAAYCEVHGFCTKHNKWHLVNSGSQTSIGRQLQQPTFFMQVPDSIESTTALDVINELLAEALMASYRGMPRLTVINSYTALESYANLLFSQLQVANLVANNVPREYAEQTVQDHRLRHRNDASFLFHSGIKTASGHSLLEEDNTRYDSVMKIQQLRHRVAHTGHKPSLSEAREAHLDCCEAVRWFSTIAGLAAKPLRPSPGDSVNGFVAGLGGTC
jgi:hypothetical protein